MSSPLGQVEGVLPQVAAGHPAEAAGGVRAEPGEDHGAAARLLREEQGAAAAEAERELRQEPGAKYNLTQVLTI